MILIGLGSSLKFCGAEPHEIIGLALGAIGEFAPVEANSRFFASPAWPDPSDPPFVNAVAIVRTKLEPAPLLAALHGVEAAFGRRRQVKNAPRTLDLDLLAYGRRIIAGEEGKPNLPHPGLHTRDFVLAPLCEIAPDWVDPRSGLTAADLLQALPARSATPID